MLKCLNLFYFLFIDISLKTVQHAVESDLCCIGDEGKDGMVDIAIDGFQDGINQLLTKPFPFVVNVAIGATAEIDAFKRASRIAFLFHDSLNTAFAVASYK